MTGEWVRRVEIALETLSHTSSPARALVESFDLSASWIWRDRYVAKAIISLFYYIAVYYSYELTAVPPMHGT